MALTFHQTVRQLAHLGEALRRRRRELGWTQAELGARSGVKQAAISAIEHGVAAARAVTLFRLLAALDLELDLRSRS